MSIFSFMKGPWQKCHQNMPYEEKAKEEEKKKEWKKTFRCVWVTNTIIIFEWSDHIFIFLRCNQLFAAEETTICTNVMLAPRAASVTYSIGVRGAVFWCGCRFCSTKTNITLLHRKLLKFKNLPENILPEWPGKGADALCLIRLIDLLTYA